MASITLDQQTIMMLASVLRKGSVKQTHTVKRITNYVRQQRTGVFGERVGKDGTILKNAYQGSQIVEEKYPEAYEVTLPARSPNDEPNTITLLPQEMAHFGLTTDGGLVDMETGEQLLAGTNVITLPISKSA